MSSSHEAEGDASGELLLSEDIPIVRYLSHERSQLWRLILTFSSGPPNLINKDPYFQQFVQQTARLLSNLGLQASSLGTNPIGLQRSGECSHARGQPVVSEARLLEWHSVPRFFAA